MRSPFQVKHIKYSMLIKDFGNMMSAM